MKATKWYRRAGAESCYTGGITVVRFGSRPEEIHLDLSAHEGDDVNRLKVQLSLEEARVLRDSLTHLLDVPREKWVDEKREVR
jgi:hypothetical protein